MSTVQHHSQLRQRKFPREAETQRSRESENPRIRVPRESYETDESDEFRTFSACRTLKDAALAALSYKAGNGDGVFTFARAVKAFEAFNGITLPAIEMRNTFNHWWTEARMQLPADADQDEYFLCFLDARKKVKSPLGENSLEAAVKLLSETAPPAECSAFESQKIKKLIHLCFALQSIEGDSPFFVSQRDAGALLECDRKTAGKWLNGLVQFGILKLVAKGISTGPRESWRAARFHYVQAQPRNVIKPNFE